MGIARAFEGWHLVIIALVVLVLFGSKKLPDAARSFGRSLRIFKAETKGLRDDKSDDDDIVVQRQQQAQHLPQPLPPGPEVSRPREATPAAEVRRDEH